MTRIIPESMVESIAAPIVEPFYAVEFYLDDATVRLWTGSYTIEIAGYEYVGVGDILSISSIQETADTQANGATIGISGIPAQYITMALQEQYQGRGCRILFGVLSSPSDMVEVFSGEIDKMDITENADSATVVVSVENVLIILERSVVRRFTHEDQQTRYPGDLGFVYVAGLQDKELFFGRKSV